MSSPACSPHLPDGGAPQLCVMLAHPSQRTGVAAWVNGDCEALPAVDSYPFEVGSGLSLAVKRKRIDRGRANEFIEDFISLDIPLVVVGLRQAWEVAEEQQLTVYDAAYLTLARSMHIPLLTFDEKLVKLARV